MNNAVKIVIVAVSVLLAAAVPLADVYVSSLQMEKYCEAEAGTHIYKTDIVDGFYFNRFKNAKFGVNHHLNLFRYGYKYYEFEHDGKYYFVTKKNNMIISQENDGPQSQYEYFYETNVVNDHLLRQQQVIKNIHTENVIARDVDFSYYPGWMDRQIANLIGDYSPPHCDISKISVSEFYLSVLQPSGSIN